MTPLLARLVIAIGGATELAMVLKATLVLGLTLMVVQLAPRARASVRHSVVAAAFAVLLTLPMVTVLLPPVVVPISIPNMSDPVVSRAREGSFAMKYLGDTDGPTPTTVSSRSPVSASAVFRAGWMVGALLFLVPLPISLLRIRRIRRSGWAWSDGESLVRSLATEAGVRRRVVMLLHDDIVVPMTCGFWRPAIVLPSDATRWTSADVHHAVVHECEHVRRADWPTHLMARVVCALYWFHPFVWIAWRHLCLESERACDDAVLRDADQAAYADQLVNLARRLLKRSTRHALSMASRSDLSARIAAVLDIQQLRGRIGIRRAAMIGVVAVVLLLAISPLRAVGRSGYELRRLAAHSFVPVGNGVTALQPSTQAPTGLVPLAMDVLSRPTLKVRTQAADAIPSAFEGVSVKPNPSGRSGVHKGPTLSGNELIAIDVQVRWLIVEAYRLSSYQLLGGPGWISTDYFDITAKVPASASVEQWRLMLRTLLADRFHLIVHTETKDEPIYAIVVADLNGALGPNLHRTTTDCAALRAAAGPDVARTTIPCSFNLQLGRRAGRGLDIATLAGWLSPDAGRMVVDKTGLEGVFDFDLTYTPDPLRHHPPDRFPTVDPEGPSILAAVQEQLGLKLEAQQNLGDVLVIDHVEQPTPD